MGVIMNIFAAIVMFITYYVSCNDSKITVFRRILVLAEITSDNTRLLTQRAADELLAEGIRPTVVNVRDRIGRGSASTINAALQEWWAGLSQRLADARSQPDLPAPLVDAMRQLWDAALAQAHGALAEYRAEADRKVVAATENTSAAITARDEATMKLGTLQKNYQELTDTRLDLERRLTVEAERHQVAERRIQELQAEADRRIQEARDRIDQLEGLLSRERDRCDQMEVRLTQQVEEQKVARSKVEAKYKEEVTEWRKEKQQLLIQYQEVHQRLAESQGRNAALTDQITALQADQQALRNDKDRLLAECVEGQARLLHAVSLEETLRGEINALRQTIEIVEEDRAALRLDLEAARKALVHGQREHGSVDSTT